MIDCPLDRSVGLSWSVLVCLGQDNATAMAIFNAKYFIPSDHPMARRNEPREHRLKRPPHTHRHSVQCVQCFWLGMHNMMSPQWMGPPDAIWLYLTVFEREQIDEHELVQEVGKRMKDFLQPAVLKCSKSLLFASRQTMRSKVWRLSSGQRGVEIAEQHLNMKYMKFLCEASLHRTPIFLSLDSGAPNCAPWYIGCLLLIPRCHGAFMGPWGLEISIHCISLSHIDCYILLLWALFVSPIINLQH